LTVVQGSIIHIKADALVHPTNSSFSFGGEVGQSHKPLVMPIRIVSHLGNALSKAGGQQLRDATNQMAKNKILANVGDGSFIARQSIHRLAFVSVGIGDAPNLSASHLIHVHSPTWNASNQTQCITDLDTATTNILTLADEQGLNSVAVPSISSGK
jgi:O-acetyl-ADP-ribose deacetylase (regulator of RNase III)